MQADPGNIAAHLKLNMTLTMLTITNPMRNGHCKFAQSATEYVYVLSNEVESVGCARE